MLFELESLVKLFLKLTCTLVFGFHETVFISFTTKFSCWHTLACFLSALRGPAEWCSSCYHVRKMHSCNLNTMAHFRGSACLSTLAKLASRLGMPVGSSTAWNTESSQMVLFSTAGRIRRHVPKRSLWVHLSIPSFVRPELGSTCPEHSSWTWSQLL